MHLLCVNNFHQLIFSFLLIPPNSLSLAPLSITLTRSLSLTKRPNSVSQLLLSDRIISD